MGRTETNRSAPPPAPPAAGQAGIALLAVLWAVALLSLLVLVVSSSVQLEVRTATYRKEAAQGYALARGGVEVAVAELAYPRRPNQEKSPLWSWKPGQREGSLRFESGTVELAIVSQSGQLDLNAASPLQLARLFEARGLEPAAASQLAAAIVHWRSPQSPEPEAEAVDAYYRARNERPRHARFASVEELLQVRGMTREIFYGTAEVSEEGKIRRAYGVGQDLTVFSRSPLVNVNYASEEVLRSVPGVGPELARTLVAERGREPFAVLSEISQRLPLSLPGEALPFLTTSVSDTYSIQAVGAVAGSRVRRTVRAVVQLKPAGGLPYRIVAWYDDSLSD